MLSLKRSVAGAIFVFPFTLAMSLETPNNNYICKNQSFRLKPCQKLCHILLTVRRGARCKNLNSKCQAWQQGQSRLIFVVCSNFEPVAKCLYHLDVPLKWSYCCRSLRPIWQFILYVLSMAITCWQRSFIIEYNSWNIFLSVKFKCNCLLRISVTGYGKKKHKTWVLVKELFLCIQGSWRLYG